MSKKVLNKKSYILILALISLSVFSYVFLNIIKNTNLQNSNNTRYILYTQARLHLNFLEKYIRNTNLENIKNIKIENDSYDIRANIENENIHLFVKHKNYRISLYKKILLK